VNSNLPDRQPAFRFTPQVAVILLIVMVALIAPLAGVVLLVRDSIRASQNPAPEPVEPSTEDVDQTLRTALENVADSVLNPDAALPPRPTIQIVANSEAEQSAFRARLAKLVAQADGFIVNVSTGESPAEEQFFVTLPASWMPDFEKAMRGELHAPPPVKTESGKEETSIVEVRLKRSAE
jgi:hypothetical protein